MTNKYNIQAWSAGANQSVFNGVLFVLPVFVLLWLPGVWVCYVVLLALYYSGSANGGYFAELKAYQKNTQIRYIVYVFIGYFMFSIADVFFLKSPLKSIDNACVFLLWLAISPVIAILQPSSRALGYGCAAATGLALVLAVVQFHFYHIERPYGTYGTGFPGSGAIKFGDIALLIGIFAYLFLSGHKYHLGLIGLVSGFSVCLYAGARGGILAAVICGIAWLCTGRQKKIALKNIIIVLLAIGGLIFLLNNMMGNHIVHRVLHTKDEFDFFNRDNLNTSSGVRVQMWKAALLIFKEHPILGVGLNNYDDALLALYKKGLVSKLVIVFAHAHNEYVCALATGGVVGFFMTVCLLGIPANYFRRYCQQSVWAVAGFWGIGLMAGFALTDCIFDRRMTVVMFVLLVTICMAGCMGGNSLVTPAKGNRLRGAW